MIRTIFSLIILWGLGAFAVVQGSTAVDKRNVGLASGAPACTGAQLSVKVDPKFEGNSATGGQRAEQFVVKNVSRFACTITGTPGLALFDARGREMGKAMKPTREGGTTTLKAGGIATLEVGYHSCVFVAGAVEGRNPKKCRISQTARIRFARIDRVFSTRDRIDAVDGFERVFEFKAK